MTRSSRFVISSALVVAVSWTLTLVLWSENRALLGMLQARDAAAVEYVKHESFKTLVGACQIVSDVNKRQENLLYRARANMEEIDAIREENHRRAEAEAEDASRKASRRNRGRRHGQVRSGP